MKRVSKIVLLLLLIMPFVVKANSVTKEDLKNAYKYMLECKKEGNHTEAEGSVSFDTSGGSFGSNVLVCNDTVTGSSINTADYITDDTIYFYVGTKKYEMKYEIKEDGKVEFRHTYQIDRDTAVADEVWNYEKEITNSAFLGLSIVGVAGGLKYGELELYTSFSESSLEQHNATGSICTSLVDTQEEYNQAVAGNPNCIVALKTNFAPKAIEFATSLLGDKDASFDDSESAKLYTMSITHDLTNPDKYSKTFVLTVNANSELLNFAGLPDGDIKKSVDPTTEANPKTGAFMSVMTVVVLLGALLFISLKNKSYINKI